MPPNTDDAPISGRCRRVCGTTHRANRWCRRHGITASATDVATNAQLNTSNAHSKCMCGARTTRATPATCAERVRACEQGGSGGTEQGTARCVPGAVARRGRVPAGKQRREAPRGTPCFALFLVVCQRRHRPLGVQSGAGVVGGLADLAGSEYELQVLPDERSDPQATAARGIEWPETGRNWVRHFSATAPAQGPAHDGGTPPRTRNG
jgi:hypothetical protein